MIGVTVGGRGPEIRRHNTELFTGPKPSRMGRYRKNRDSPFSRTVTPENAIRCWGSALGVSLEYLLILVIRMRDGTVWVCIEAGMSGILKKELQRLAYLPEEAFLPG